MGQLTNYAETALVKHMVKETLFTRVATLYIGFTTSDPGETGSLSNEVATAGSTGYARQTIAFSAISDITTRRITQTGDTITFPTATAAWGTISHWFISDGGTRGAGNVLAYGSLPVSKDVQTGNTPTIAGSRTYIELPNTGKLSDWAACKFLERMFRNQDVLEYTTDYPAMYLGLATTTVTRSMHSNNGAGTAVTDPSGNNYSRLTINPTAGSTPKWAATADDSGDAKASNSGTWTMATPSGSWGNVKSAFISTVANTSGASGQIIMFGDITAQDVTTDDVVEFLVGQFSFKQS
jgi:hypothetical protein